MFVVPASAGVSLRLHPRIAKASSIHGLKAELRTQHHKDISLGVFVDLK